MGVVIRQTIKGTIVTYIGTFIGFLTYFVVLTNFFTAEEIGLTHFIIDASFLFAGLAQFGTNSSIIRFFPYFKNEKHNGFFFWTVIIPLIGFIVFGLIFTLLKASFCNYFADNSPLFLKYYYYILPLGFFILYMTVFETNSNVLMRIVVPKFVKEVLVRILSLIAYILFAYHIINMDYLIVLLCIIYLIACLINILYVFFYGKVSFKPNFKFVSKKLFKDYCLYTLFLITSALSTVIIPFLNNFFISGEMGLSFTGIFTIALYIAVMVEIPYRSLGAISQPEISKAIKEADFKTANLLSKKVSLNQYIVGLFIIFVIWTNIDLVFHLMPNGETYSSAKYVVLILGFTRLIYSSFNIGINILSFSKYYYYSLVFTIILTFSAIVLNIKLIPLWGINGAALASLFSNIIYYAISLIIIYILLGTNPLSLKQVKATAIITLMFLLAFIWDKYCYVRINIPIIYSDCINAMLKTIIICTIGMVTLYKWQISTEINTIINKVIKYTHKVL